MTENALLLEIQSESPLRLEIPNPSDDLKKHIVDSVLAKFTFVNVLTTDLPALEPQLPLNPSPEAGAQQYTAKLQPETSLPVVPLSDAKPEPIKPAFNSVNSNSVTKHLKKPEQQEPVIKSPVADAKLAELKERMQNKEPLVDQPATEPQKDYYLTGIKVRTVKGEEVSTYKCRYKCTNYACRKEANHYIPENTHNVKCHECGEDLKVKKSMPSGDVLEKDPYGNFYVAGNRRPFHEASLSHKH